MSAAPDVTGTTRKIIALQIVAAAVVAAGFFAGKGQWPALSAGYGGLSGVLLSLLLSRGVSRAAEAAATDRNKSMWILYLGAIQRFLLVLVLFGIGLAGLRLEPLAVVAGFASAQLAYVISMRGARQA